ncbi:DUF3006 domain-containing protein [Planococcus sp. NCCP-2050]|uniref:DUF3006 domain-containing protein n=1 Tax=Planococcus sp. NCCP-2050 TaxID=2944679 RepID=UPI00203F5000|nr:DUF3006 domain-containing protein [Planococcus sp. NCCP-2050]GKW47013.1 hypothetical protein NCCP2050_27050 [Planococcus sp. NCCP-2050]
MMKRYTLDRLDDGFYVFLEKGNEEQQLLIPKEEISSVLTDGDIVDIQQNETGYQISVLKEETTDRKQQVMDLIEKLKNK